MSSAASTSLYEKHTLTGLDNSDQQIPANRDSILFEELYDEPDPIPNHPLRRSGIQTAPIPETPIYDEINAVYCVQQNKIKYSSLPRYTKKSDIIRSAFSFPVENPTTESITSPLYEEVPFFPNQWKAYNEEQKEMPNLDPCQVQEGTTISKKEEESTPRYLKMLPLSNKTVPTFPVPFLPAPFDLGKELHKEEGEIDPCESNYDNELYMKEQSQSNRESYLEMQPTTQKFDSHSDNQSQTNRESYLELQPTTQKFDSHSGNDSLKQNSKQFRKKSGSCGSLPVLNFKVDGGYVQEIILKEETFPINEKRRDSRKFKLYNLFRRRKSSMDHSDIQNSVRSHASAMKNSHKVNNNGRGKIDFKESNNNEEISIKKKGRENKFNVMNFWKKRRPSEDTTIYKVPKPSQSYADLFDDRILLKKGYVKQLSSNFAAKNTINDESPSKPSVSDSREVSKRGYVKQLSTTYETLNMPKETEFSTPRLLKSVPERRNTPMNHNESTSINNPLVTAKSMTNITDQEFVKKGFVRQVSSHFAALDEQSKSDIRNIKKPGDTVADEFKCFNFSERVEVLEDDDYEEKPYIPLSCMQKFAIPRKNIDLANKKGFVRQISARYEGLSFA